MSSTVLSIIKWSAISTWCLLINSSQLSAITSGKIHPNYITSTGVLCASNYQDTTTFYVTRSSGIKTLSFNDHNTLNIAPKGVSLAVKEESEDLYALSVKLKGKQILFKQHLKGISKVLIDDEYLSFSTYSYVDEDGNNEGNGYIIDLKHNLVMVFRRKLKNTSNPLVLNNNFYFLDGLNLIETGLDLKIHRYLKIEYLSKNKSYSYLDKYAISRLSQQDNGQLIIDFSEDRFVSKHRSYSGVVDIKSKVISLMQN
jgi:hypothetical protein